MKGDFKSYKDLEVWRKAMDLVRNIYKITKTYPDDEKFGLSIQMRKAAISIPSNIAEGHARLSTAEFMRFISITLGSVAELETQIIISFDLDYINQECRNQLVTQTDIIGKMLRGLYKSLDKRR